METESKTKIINFTELLQMVDYTSAISTTDQIEKELTRSEIALVKINDIIVDAKELVAKLARVELVLCRQGNKEATECWFKMGLPELYFN
jgi:hypothetical protein